MSFASLTSTHTITIQRPVIEEEASGGTKRTNWEAVPDLTEILCAILPMSTKEKIVWGQKNIIITDKIYTTSNISALIQRSDRILEPLTGRLFKIIGIRDLAGRQLVTEIECLEWTN